MRTNPLPRLGEGIYSPLRTGHVGFVGVQHSLGPFLGPMIILRAFALFYGTTDTLRVTYILDIGEACGIDEDKLNNVISVLKDRGSEFDDRLDEINLDLSHEFVIRVMESKVFLTRRVVKYLVLRHGQRKAEKCCVMPKAAKDERGRRVLAATVEDETVLFVRP
nr:hypothetical protein [Tanacetum cinerariifolium]